MITDVLDIIGDKFGFNGVTDVCFKSDRGTHYAAMELISCAASDWIQTVRSLNNSRNPDRKPDHGLASTHVLFGAGQHSKSKDDGQFGVIRGRVKDMATRKPVTQMSHIMQALTDGANTVAQQPHRSHEIFVDFLPSMTKEQFFGQSNRCYTLLFLSEYVMITGSLKLCFSDSPMCRTSGLRATNRLVPGPWHMA